jgi:GT2 family glycosyltransferase/glycosyltransferase involved in cell wall biosynthesis
MLATARLADGDAAAARTLFEAIASRYAARDLFAGIAACAFAAGDRRGAATAIARALTGYTPTPEIIALARACAHAPGWCALDFDGTLHIEANAAPIILLDGQPIRLTGTNRLPGTWVEAAALAVTCNGQHLHGSPIDLAARQRTEGFVALAADGIEGWAWHPASPETDPVVSIRTAGKRVALTATDLGVAFSGSTPLARPRAFRMACDTAAPVRVTGRDGRDFWGSPLGGSAPAPPARRPRRSNGSAVVIPVYRGLAVTRACLESVLATRGPQDEIIVVNDASPEPALVAALLALRDTGKITLLASCPNEPSRNLGFPAAANVGLAHAAGRDAVLLNSDTLVFPGWLAALRAAAHGAPDIGTATPLSNDATIFTYPDPAAPSPMPTQVDGARLARLAARANRGSVVEVPTGHGFCLYLRADCLHRVGLLRAGLFAQGYGEENDFCERARARGFKHVAAPGVYVAHQGGASFGAARDYLLRRNVAVLHGLYPTYADRVDAFIAADPLAPARHRLDLARLRAATKQSKGAVLLVTHGGIGGTARVVRERAAAAAAQGLAPIILRGDDGHTTLATNAEDTPNLRYRLPDGAAALLQVLRALRPVRLEWHHLMGHHPSLAGLLERLALPTELWVHDYGWLCPRLALVTGEGRFCGEPPAADCIPCVARWGQAFDPPIDAASLRARSARLIAAADRVVAASSDVATRIRRHFPAARLDVRPLQEESRVGRAAPGPPGALTLPRRVAVVGAIGMEKGYELLLACARDAAARNLPLHFVVVGYTIDDTPLLQTGHVFVTGPYEHDEAATLIAATGAHVALLPSIWPETWCYALTDAWNGGLDTIVFDIGTPAERVCRAGRGAVLPLGLPPSSVNDALLNPQFLACRSEPPRA